MSNRSLIEINHDFAKALNTPAFLDALAMYVNSASREHRAALLPFGVKVFGMRHHSEDYHIEWGAHRALEQTDK